jgi:hypothetical protein
MKRNLTYAELETAIAQQLQTTLAHLTADEQRHILSVCAMDLARELNPTGAAERRITDDLGRADVAYTVSDQELKGLPELVVSVLGLLLSAPAGALPGLVGLLFRYRQHRIELTGEEALVLRCLKAEKQDGRGGLTAAQLWQILRHHSPMALQEVTRTLEDLQTKGDAQAVQLVEFRNGRWSISDA